jgi:hypothetical protein
MLPAKLHLREGQTLAALDSGSPEDLMEGFGAGSPLNTCGLENCAVAHKIEQDTVRLNRVNKSLSRIFM